MCDEIQRTARASLAMYFRKFRKPPPFIAVVEGPLDKSVYSGVFQLESENLWIAYGKSRVLEDLIWLIKDERFKRAFGIVDWDNPTQQPEIGDFPISRLRMPILVTDGRDLESMMMLADDRMMVLKDVLQHLLTLGNGIDSSVDRLCHQIVEVASYVGAVQLVSQNNDSWMKRIRYDDLIPRDLTNRSRAVSEWLSSAGPPSDGPWLNRDALNSVLERRFFRHDIGEFLEEVEALGRNPEFSMHPRLLCRGHDLISLVQMVSRFVGSHELDDLQVEELFAEKSILRSRHLKKRLALTTQLEKKVQK